MEILPLFTKASRDAEESAASSELKMIKPSDTRWLAHERCVKSVKRSYSAIVLSLNNIYEESHEPEALGLSKAMCKQSTITAIYLLDFILPQVARLSKTLQTEKLDLTIVSSLVDATLHTLDDSMLAAANWVLELLDEMDDLMEATGIKITMDDISNFQERVGKPFVSDLKNNISSSFTSQDIVSSMSIFDPSKLLNVDSPGFTSYGDSSIDTLIQHYGKDREAQTIDGEEYLKKALISPELHTEWKTFRQFFSKHPEEDMKLQLKELVTNAMLVSMFPNLNALANICLAIPVSTASVERSFSQMKMIKTRLRSQIGASSLSHLMKIAIESPEKLSDDDLEQIIKVWNRKPRRIAV